MYIFFLIVRDKNVGNPEVNHLGYLKIVILNLLNDVKTELVVFRIQFGDMSMLKLGSRMGCQE